MCINGCGVAFSRLLFHFYKVSAQWGTSKDFEIAKLLVGAVDRHVLLSRGKVEHIPRLDGNLLPVDHLRGFSAEDNDDRFTMLMKVIRNLAARRQKSEHSTEVLCPVCGGQDLGPIRTAGSWICLFDVLAALE